ncbi:cytochrome b561 [Labrys miyagiensis]|uniref:Cytochrome b561 n=1 Tax=Labrys miyagiensis TaxID=346912 RepID=A0ABQ6CDS2_9HYPH|nr:cytochrome b/b6 domain-containing protein [Labrys miyagiensis]GLS18512.1 cytochrome b561 [Labrys miyagiensis]
MADRTRTLGSNGLENSHPIPIKVWDLPTRLFKWLLVSFVITAWVSSGFSDPNMAVHKAAGYGVLVLAVYRLLWGIFGGTTARFSNFVHSPREIVVYLRSLHHRKVKTYLGHNPAGGAMVLALILACAIQPLLGLFASDGVTASGPLADMVGDQFSGWATAIHSLWFYVILALAVVHVAVNLYYQFIRGENLIGAMITGTKLVERSAAQTDIQQGSLLVAGLCLIAAGAIVYFGVTLVGGAFFAEA